MSSASSPPSASQSRLSRVVNSLAKVEGHELSTVLAAFFLFFFVLGSYFAVRPVRETIATLLGRAYVADLWLYTAAFSIAIVPAFGWLVARVRRGLLLPWIYGAVAIIFVAVGLVFRADENSRAVGAFFYVWISVLNLMLVSLFWSFLLEIFSSVQAKRLFGFISAGGTAGALMGPIVTRFAVDSVGNSGILFIGAVGFIGAIVCQRILIRIWTSSENAAVTRVGEERPVDAATGGNPFAGIGIVLRSPFLWGIAGFVVLLSAANTFVYFEQLRIVEESFSDTGRRTQVFANIDIIVQSLTILTQLFLTGRIASTLGVRALLTIVPCAMVIGFVALAMAPVLSVVLVVLVARRWGEYALVRPGREMLFSAFDTETKYKAKNFIDVPVYRAADYVGGQAKTALDVLGSGPTGASLVAAALAAIWVVLGWFLGRAYDRKPQTMLRTAEAPAE
ncbi:MAG: NTP/NDP exchange transporter [Rhodospirillaceae bacterium]